MSKSVVLLILLVVLNVRSANADSLSSKGLPSGIEIELSYTSISYHKAENYQISIANGRAKRGVENVPITAVAGLVTAIDKPRLTEPSLANLGITKPWLDAECKSALNSYYERWVDTPRLDDKQEAYFLRTFSDPGTATTWMNDWSSGQTLRLDDYPLANVRLDWPNGTSYRLTSHSWYVFMLPWSIGADNVADYDADISRNVASLLPANALNRERLAGDTLSAEYTDWLMEFDLRGRLDSIGASDVLGDQLAPIEKSFTITSMSNETISSDDLNEDLVNPRPSLQLHVQDPLLPSYVVVYMSLWSKGDKLKDVPQAVSAARRYTSLALSVPWMSWFLRQNKDWSAEIRVVQDRSITPQLAKSLLSDLRDHGKAKLADMLQPLLPQTAFLYLNGPPDAYSRLFVLPDHRMLLWNFKRNTPFSNSIKDMPQWDWFGHVGVGALFSPDGRLLM